MITGTQNYSPGPTPDAQTSPNRTGNPERTTAPWPRVHDLASLAATTANGASLADRDAAVDAGLLASAAAATRPQPGQPNEGTGHAPADAVVRTTVHAAQTVSQQHLDLGSRVEIEWTGFGVVVPILGASSGCGASVVAAVLADAAQAAGRSVLLVDTADPARSGLNRAAASDGPQTQGPHPAVRVRFSWRGRALLARAETTLPVLTPGMLPPPGFWRPGERPIDVTVVDLAHDPWRVTAHPLAGSGTWLRTGVPPPRPILVVRPTIPSLAHAEQILARLEPWVRHGTAVAPVHLVVASATKWPSAVIGTAGRRLRPLLADATFLPHDTNIATRGITAAATPKRLRAKGTVALQRTLEPNPTSERPAARRRSTRPNGDIHTASDNPD